VTLMSMEALGVEPRDGLTGQVLDVEHVGVLDRALRDGLQLEPGSNKRHPCDKCLGDYERGVGAQCSGLTETVWMRLYPDL